MTPTQRATLEQALESLLELVPDPQIDFGPAYEGAKQRRKKSITALRAALAEQPAEQEPVAHDKDLLERLYWEFDRQRKKTEEERLAFKGKMRFYASDFRRVSIGKAAFSQSATDDMMNLADRLGNEYDDVDPKAWKHLLVYAPQPVKREPLTDEEVLKAWSPEPSRPVMDKNKVLTFARDIEQAHGITKKQINKTSKGNM